MMEAIRIAWKADAAKLDQVADDLAVAAASAGTREAVAAIGNALEWLDDVVELLKHTERRAGHDHDDDGGPADRQ